MNYKPLKGLRGIQMQADFTRFQFSWDSAGNDSRVHFIWIYKEDELNNPRMFSYAQCIDNRIQVAFQYNNIPMQEIRKIRFLVFLSEDQRAPSREDLASLYQYSDYSIQEISFYLGFSSQSHFCKVFQEITGETPGHYKRQFANRKKWKIQ